MALALALVVMLASPGCSKGSTNTIPLLPFMPGASKCQDITVPAGASVLGSGPVLINGRWVCYYLLRLEYGGNDPSYAMWIPPIDGGVKPAMVLTRPYDYIRWSGDTIPASTPVVSNPQYVRDSTLFLINGMGVLHVFERYYSGGSIQNDVNDTVAGLRFLKDSGFADTSRIGIWGGSWGGFEALYGAAYAADGGGAVPLAGVAFFPVSDFYDEVDYIEQSAGAGVIPNHIQDVTDDAKRSQYVSFFAPYIDRIKATAGWSGWTGANLLAKLSVAATSFVVIHDEWDTLVPFEQSKYLADNSPLITPLYFYQDTERDLNLIPAGWGHGELREYQLDATPPPAQAITYGMSNTLASAYVNTRIAAPGQSVLLVGYDLNALNDFIAYLRDFKCVHNREQMAWAARLLRDCTDSRIFMVEMNDFSIIAGAEIIAKAFSDAGWGGPSYGSAAGVRTALEGGLPVCP